MKENQKLKIKNHICPNYWYGYVIFVAFISKICTEPPLSPLCTKGGLRGVVFKIAAKTKECCCFKINFQENI